MNKKLILVIALGIIAILVVLSLAFNYIKLPGPKIKSSFSFSQNLSSPICKIWRDNIEKAFVNDNFCSVDSDCQAIPLGGEYVAFGCIHYLNKNIAKTIVYSALDDYARKCSNAVDDCGFTLETKCEANKCVAKPTENANDQSLQQAAPINFDKIGALTKENDGTWTLVYSGDNPPVLSGLPQPTKILHKVYLVFTGKSICINLPNTKSVKGTCNTDKLFDGAWVIVRGRLYDTNKVAVSELSVTFE